MSAAPVTLPRRSQPRGLWGLLLFLGTESLLFGCLIGSYFYLRVKSVHWPPEGIPEPKALWPLVLTAVLMATSVPMHAAWRWGRAGRARPALAALLVAGAVQIAYLVIVLHRYADDVQAHAPERHAYNSITHLLSGADHFHVVVGILFTLFMAAKLLDGRVTGYRLTGLQTAAWYWHAVNAITLLVVLVELTPRL